MMCTCVYSVCVCVYSPDAMRAHPWLRVCFEQQHFVDVPSCGVVVSADEDIFRVIN